MSVLDKKISADSHFMFSSRGLEVPPEKGNVFRICPPQGVDGGAAVSCPHPGGSLAVLLGDATDTKLVLKSESVFG